MTIHTGDCIEVMAAMEPDSVDAVVTDPPYGIGFMGKVWDAFDQNAVEASWSGKGRNHTSERDPDASTPGGRSTTRTGFRETNPRCGICGRVTRGRDTAKGFKVCHCEKPVIIGTPNRDAQRFQAWCEAWGRAALRVTKPGGYLLAFGGTRTHHRLVCGLEDAGWIIRDELTWIYASGFPKGKANLKPAHEPIVLARKPGPLRPLAIDECRIQTTEIGKPREPSRREDRENWRIEGGSNGSGATDPAGRWPSNLILSDPELFDQPNPYVVGSGATDAGGGYGVRGAGGNVYGGGDGYTTNMPETGQTVGYGDTGGYSRFFTIPRRNDGSGTVSEVRGETDANESSEDGGTASVRPRVRGPRTSPRGDSETPAARGEYPVALIVPKADRADREPVLRGQLVERAGNAAEYAQAAAWLCVCGAKYPGGFKECPKCGGEDRQFYRASVGVRSNSHPTVKPTDLMRHLVRLVTPQGGTVLDCFAGSGSTLIAAELEGFSWIAIEKEEEYVKIMEARLNGTQRGMGLVV